MSSSLLFKLFLVICLALGVSDFVYHRHGYTAIEETPLFYVIFSFVACFVSALIANYIIRPLVNRDEDYYDR